MKQNNNQSALTKKDVEEVLDEKFKDYPTIKDLDDRFVKYDAASRAESEYRFNIMMEDFRTQITKFKDVILTAIDPLIKYVDERREEKELEAHQLNETRTQLENHEKRIKKLEQS